MANHADRRVIGERYTARHPSEQARGISTIPPLPYFPNLKLEIRSVTAALVFTYLEIHHPAPQDPLGGISSPAVTVNLDTVCDALQIARRTLKISLSILAVWWRSEAQRFAAHRAGLEFMRPEHTRHGRIKPYSVVGPAGWKPGISIQLRRNLPRLQQLLNTAQVQTLAVTPLTPQAQAKSQDEGIEGGGISAPTSSIQTQKSRLADLLLRASVLDGDRRKVRYPRLRAAVGDNLLDVKALSAKQPKRGRNMAEDPDLPAGMEQRMKKRSR